MRRLPRLVALVGLAMWCTPSAPAKLMAVGHAGWQVRSSAQAGPWLHVRADDAGAPGTAVGALVQTGHCRRVFYAENMKRCFGYLSSVGVDTIPRFAVPWWFRTTFAYRPRRARYAQLIVNGVVGAAVVWLGGQRLGTVRGDYTRYAFDVTRIVRQGANVLSMKVFPNNPQRMFTLDNVDWTQIPPDNNTGIQFPIQLHTSGPLALSDTHVVQHDSRGFSRAVLTLKGVVANLSRQPQSGLVTATVARHRLTRPVSLAPRATRTISLRVVIRHPHVWWPYEMGQQPLYQLRMSVRQGGRVSDSSSETFGIRTVTTRLIGRSPIAPDGSRQFLVNGRPFIFRGGGWSEDLFLRYSKADTATQIALIKNLGLNGIRTEGHVMPDGFYEQMDRAGILIDGGFQCCDAWQLQSSGLTSAHDFRVLYNSARTIGRDLRNHPSVLDFSWSDNNPTRRQEAVSLAGFRAADLQDPLIASAEYKRSFRLGPSGEKEGPYDWVPPSYWYDSTHYSQGDPTRTNVGGAWAFDSEASAGDTVPTIDSITRFMSPFERARLWRSPKYNQYHLNYEPALPGPSNGGYSFGTLFDFDRALAARYGPWSSLAGYVEKAQVANYETQRAEFEAYIAHSTRRRAPSTGVVYWQLNKGWPTLLWDLYNHDYDQAGSYFGAKKANESLHVLYAYDDRSVAVDNLGRSPERDLSVEANVYSLDGTLLDHRVRGGIGVRSQGMSPDVLHPAVPSTTVPPAPARTYFIELLLRRRGAVIDRNVYWLSTQEDVVNWAKTIGEAGATMRQFADLTALQSLAPAHITVTARTYRRRGPDGADTMTAVMIKNTSTTVAFFLRADVFGAGQVLPIFWSDNDITLWPGESETLRASYRRSALRGRSTLVKIAGWNLAGVSVTS